MQHAETNSGTASSRVSLTSKGQGTSFDLVGHSSNDDVKVKIVSGADYTDQLCTPCFIIGLVKIKFEIINQLTLT